jgi:hypothetical protein
MRAEQRARAAVSGTGATLAHGAESLSAAAVALDGDELVDARTAADRAVALLADVEHPAADRLAALAENLRPEITDTQREGVADALRHEAHRIARHDAGAAGPGA